MDTHHAFLAYANSIDESAIPEALKKQSTDVQHILRDRFSIDDARELSSLASLTSFEAPQRIFVIAANDIAVEAQNALLKLFEEPPAHARFYVVIPRVSMLLPTLLSRLFVFDPVRGAASADSNEAFASFAAASYGQRLEAIATKTKEKDSAWIEAILHGCESEASSLGSTSASLLKAVLFARSYIRSKGASVKMLLEEIALDLPLR